MLVELEAVGMFCSYGRGAGAGCALAVEPPPIMEQAMPPLVPELVPQLVNVRQAKTNLS